MDRQTGNEATPDHRFACAKPLQELLTDANEGDDRDRITESQHAGLLRCHIATKLHQLQ